MPKHFSEKAPNSLRDKSKAAPLKVSRRRFGKNAAAMAALTVSPVSLLGVARDSGAETQGEAKTEDNAKLGITSEQAAEVDAKLANIIRKFGSRLSDEQRRHLRKILAYNERMLAGVRGFAVQNGDPPASVLRVAPMREAGADGARYDGAPIKPAAAGNKHDGAH